MRLLALFAGLLLAFSAVPVRAEDDIRQTFQRGLAEYNLGNYGEAAKLFEDVYRQKPAAALLFNIAQCYRFLGNLPKAETTYRAFLRNAKPNDKNLARGKELLAEVEQALKKQTAVANAAPHGAAPVPDQAAPSRQTRGEEAAAQKTEAAAVAQKPEPVAAQKPETVAAQKPELHKAEPPAPAEQKVAMATKSDEKQAVPAAAPENKPTPTVAPEKKATPTVALTPVPRTAPASKAVPQEATLAAPSPVVEKSHTVAWITAGGAALALAGGGFFGMKSRSTLSELQTSSHPQAQIDADRAAAKSEAGKANLLFAAGAVLAVASGTFFVIGF